MPTDSTDRLPRVYNDMVVSGASVVRPWIAVTPFRSTDLGADYGARRTGAMDAHLAARFPDRSIRYTPSGRDAIGAALAAAGLERNDCVTILTTTGNHYVSGCVTKEIERVCHWSRELTGSTRAILVIHEFGYPFQQLEELRTVGVPIIEDCAYGFASDTRGKLGQVGDFVVLSFPKYFPVQFGGALLSRTAWEGRPAMDPHLEDLLCRALDRHVADVQAIARRRHENAAVLAQRLGVFDCRPHLPSEEGTVPGVFLFTAPDGADLPALKRALYDAGVECSVFYGRHAFFVPVHQALTGAELAYIAAAVGAALAPRGAER